MVSRRQQAQDRYDHILPFIQDAANEYYGGNRDRGFRHWAFGTVFGVGPDLQGNDIYDYTAIDGSDDFEVDGYFIPETDDSSVVHLFQSKHRTPGTSMGSTEFAAFLNAPYRILNVNEVAACRNEETKALHDRLIAMVLPPNRAFSINLVWVTSGRLTQAARNHVRENARRTINVPIRGTATELTVTLQCWDLFDLHQEHEAQQRIDDTQYRCDHTFYVNSESYHRTGGEAEYPTLSMTIPVSQIIDVFARHRFNVFQSNPRGPLVNRINNRIRETLGDPINRKRFHLLNNGITAICESWRFVSDNELHVRDLQIINGCQTTYTLWDARASIVDDPAVLVNVKLTECPPTFAPTIAEATNSQASLRAEDRISNEDVQIRLNREFSSMSPPWFYEIKRGQWSKMLGGQREKERYQDPLGGYRKLTSKEVSQAVIAFAGFPGEAKDRIRDFINKAPLTSLSPYESRLHYDDIYTDRVVAVQLLLPAVIQGKVWKQVAIDKADDDYMDYARYSIVWLIGEVLREHYQAREGLFSADRSAAILTQIESWFKPLYDIAVITIKDTLDRAIESNEFSGYREFFRTPSSYRRIHSNLRSSLRLAANYGNPLANLPA